jgi:AraC-like DNA-binding protein
MAKRLKRNPKPHDAEVAPGPLDGTVRVDALRMFSEVVRELGGDPAALLAQARIPAAALTQAQAVVSYRSMIHLLERSAAELDCPDFGLRLASRQGGIAVLGPLAVAMRNSTTVGEAYRYCAGHLQVYSPVVHIQIEEDRTAGRHFMRFEILLRRVPHQRQAVENALALTHHAILTLSHGSFGAREVWFVHERLAPMATYRRYFGGPVHFEKPFNAVFFNSRDLAQPIVDQNPQLYEIASGYIDSQFPSPSMHLATRVRLVAGRLLALGLCNHVEVAARLNMHPRTLQRRLRIEGATFEGIKDEVRRDAASRYLSQSTLPLTRVASLLGYSEPSVFTRSCRRWFSSSPRKLREKWSGGYENPL